MRFTLQRLVLILSTLTGLAMLPSSLFGIHGAESALVLGLLLPPWVAVIAARRVFEARQRELEMSSVALLVDCVAFGFGALAIPVLLLAMNGMRLPNCTPWTGLAFIALGPAIGVVLAAVGGALVGSMSTSKRRATFVAAVLGLSGIGLALWRAWSTPAVFVFDHLVGYFPGTFYDPAAQVPIEYLTFRMVSLALIAALALLFTSGVSDYDWRWHLAQVGRPLAMLCAAALLLVAVGIAEQQGGKLGHRSDPQHIIATLGATVSSKRCVLHVPREMPAADRRMLADDCDFRVAQAERFLGVRQRRKVTAFFFRDVVEKKRLMGASHTYIAKPWRHEIYMKVEPWPHPVLAHEIAHVVAGNLAPAPLHIAGRLGGLWLEPTLIEGMAVASAWTPSDDLTPHQWARTLLDAGRLPDLEAMFGLRFLLHPAASVYTAAGSWLRFVRDTQGLKPLQRLYATADVSAALGKSLTATDRDWRAFLRRVEVPHQAHDIADSKFSRHSLFTATCPHRVAELTEQLSQDRLAGDDRQLLRTCQAILKLEPDDAEAIALQVAALARRGDTDAAQKVLTALHKTHGPYSPLRLAAEQAWADTAWQRGDVEQARRVYAGLLRRAQSDTVGRALDIKVAALDAGGSQAELVFAILIGTDGRGASPRLAVHLMHVLTAVSSSGAGPYLLARQLQQEGHYGYALSLLQEARRRGLPSERLEREARQLEGAALVANRDLNAATAHWRAEQQLVAKDSARWVAADDWLQRLDYLRQHALHAGRPRRSASHGLAALSAATSASLRPP